mgnify:FL=1|tara:strand:+ start:191 stop:790 length:600 start_codon:yes stop_codon:yes gene_type:complete
MNFFIKNLFLLVVLSGCSYSNFIQKNISFKEDVSKSLLNNYEQKSILAISDNKILKRYRLFDESNNNLNIWESNSLQKITTDNGKITKYSGFDNDFEIFQYRPIDIDNPDETNFASLIRFSNPETSYMDIVFKRVPVGFVEEKDKYSDQIDTYFLIKESFVVSKIKWKGQNYYWYKDKILVKSEQAIFPYRKKILIYVK